MESALVRLVHDLALATVTGLTLGVTLAGLPWIWRDHPGHLTGTAWEDTRWTDLGTGVAALAALVGVSPSLPITADLRPGLGLLVLGTGFAADAAGSLAVLPAD